MYFLDERFLGLVPVWIAVYWLAGPRLRNYVLLAGDLAWLCLFSRATVIALSALTLVIVFPLARIAGASKTAGNAKLARTTAIVGVIALVVAASVLRLKSVIFTQLGFSIADQLLQWIGFSYFLLKGIHVLFASARGIVAAPSAIGSLQYMLFLPTLTSGPIYRVDKFSEQLAAPKKLTWEDVHDGLLRVVRGVAKKVIAVPALNALFGVLHAKSVVWQPAAYVVTYVMLYLDFSGYCDIAIGIGRLLGFVVPENFKNPFTATTLTQFWRNWHATLGDWLRENVFIPWDGMRAKGWKLIAIVVGSMLVVGVWHGYALVFILWGAYHGVLLVLENQFGVKPLRSHGTRWWQLGIRFAIVQAAVIGGMFAFIHGLQL